MLERTLESYQKLLSTHDWWYFMSDDYSSWKRGNVSYHQLVSLQQEFDKDYQIWNTLCPKDFVKE